MILCLCVIVVISVFYYRATETRQAGGIAKAPGAKASGAPDVVIPDATLIIADAESNKDKLLELSNISKTNDLSNAVFIGNSSLDGLDIYGFIKEADFFYRIGLTVRTVFTQSTPYGTVPIMDELNGRLYDKVFLMFGQNELGWDYTDIFIEEYGKVVDAVKQRMPGAVIYILSLPPVSAAASAKNANGVNEKRIEEYNLRLSELAKAKDITWLDASDALEDERGYLPSDASSDGIHLNKTYSGKWAEAIRLKQ